MRKNVLLRIIVLCTLTMPSISGAGSYFVAYELGEMAFNDFKNFAGEVGYNFDNGRSLRLSYMNVALTEQHLSSSSVAAVDGDNVEGLWQGFDIYYDYPIPYNFFISPSIGYHDTEYSHVLLDESVRHRTATLGLAFSYLGDDVLGIDELYWRFTVTVNRRLDPFDDTMLGDSTVTGGSWDYYPQLFIGYVFD